jgi:uncharacterized phage protein gp47/JayE
MPAPYGVTATGFNAPTEAEILALIEADQRAEISQTLDLSEQSVLGKLNRRFAKRIADAWKATEATYHSFDPDKAVDDALVSLAKLTGTSKRGASKSTALATVTLAPETKLEAGTHFAHVAGKEDVRFTPAKTFTAPAGDAPAQFKVKFEAETAGPTQAAAGSLTVIATPVVGWLSITNAEDAQPGRLTDSSADLRLRRKQSLARAGSSTGAAIRADVLAVPNVTSVQVFENYTDDTDANGLPPHSFEVVLWDDASADNDAVAQAIGATRAGGIRPFGQTGDSGTATDANGVPRQVPFSRAAEVAIYIEFDVEERAGYLGAEAFKLAVAQALNAEFGTGEAVTFYDVLDATHGLGAKIIAVRFGTMPNPTAQTDVAISPRQIARFDSGRIAVE